MDCFSAPSSPAASRESSSFFPPPSSSALITSSSSASQYGHPVHSRALTYLKAHTSSEFTPHTLQYIDYLNTTHSGHYSQLVGTDGEFSFENLVELLITDGSPCSIFERFYEAPHPHMCFDLDFSGPEHLTLDVGSVVRDLTAEVVAALSWKEKASQTLTQACLVFKSTRPTKTSLHIHYPRLRFGSSVKSYTDPATGKSSANEQTPLYEQLLVARYVKAHVVDPALKEAIDIAPNQKGHLRLPLTRKHNPDVTDSYQSLPANTRLVFDGHYNHKGDLVRVGSRITSAKEAFLLAVHCRPLRPDEVVLTSENRSPAQRKYLKAEREKRGALIPHDPLVPARGAVVGELGIAVDMTDIPDIYSPDSCWVGKDVPTFPDFTDRVRMHDPTLILLRRIISRDSYPYEWSIRYFSLSAAVVKDQLVLKVMSLFGDGDDGDHFFQPMEARKPRYPRAEFMSCGTIYTASYPTVNIPTPSGRGTRRESFLTWFIHDPFNFRPRFRESFMVPEAMPDNTFLNTWTRWAFWHWNLSSFDRDMPYVREDPCARIHRLLYYIRYDLCAGDVTNFKYTCYHLAHIVQRPGKKTDRVLCFTGDEGSGKSTLLRAFTRVLGAAHVVTISQTRDIAETFNSLLLNKKVVLIEEARFTREQLPTINHLVTGKDLVINEKSVKQFVVPNYIDMLVATNSATPFAITKMGRRYVVIWTQLHHIDLPPAERDAYMQHRVQFLEEQETLEVFAHFLQNLDISDYPALCKVVADSTEADHMKVQGMSNYDLIFLEMIATRYNHSPIVDDPMPIDPVVPTWALKVNQLDLCEFLRKGDSDFDPRRFVLRAVDFGAHTTLDGSRRILHFPEFDKFQNNFRRQYSNLDVEKLYKPRERPTVPRLEYTEAILEHLKIVAPPGTMECERRIALIDEELRRKRDEEERAFALHVFNGGDPQSTPPRAPRKRVRRVSSPSLAVRYSPPPPPVLLQAMQVEDPLPWPGQPSPQPVTPPRGVNSAETTAHWGID